MLLWYPRLQIHLGIFGNHFTLSADLPTLSSQSATFIERFLRISVHLFYSNLISMACPLFIRSTLLGFLDSISSVGISPNHTYTNTKQFSDMVRVSRNLTQFCHYLPGHNIRFHRWRVQFCKTDSPIPYFRCQWQAPGCYLYIWSPGYTLEGPATSFFSGLSSQNSGKYVYQFIKGYDKGYESKARWINK